MASRSNYYAVLGVSPVSDDVVIRAAFKALMLKYHPDTNKSADATQRAAEINEAFSVLGDPQRRATYDYLQDNPRSPPPPPTPPPPPPKGASRKAREPNVDPLIAPPPTWAARLGALAAIALVGAVVRVAIHEAGRSNYSAGTTSAYVLSNDQTDAVGMDTMTDNMTAVEAAVQSDLSLDAVMANMADASSNSQESASLLGSLGPFAYQAPTNVDFKVIEGAANTFSKILNRGGIVGARAWSQECHENADKAPSWPAADRCAAFDFAARYIDTGMVKAAEIRPNGYFAFQADNQADNYKALGSQPYTVSERLRRIRTAVEPVTYEAVMADIRQREEKRVRENPDPAPADQSALANGSIG